MLSTPRPCTVDPHKKKIPGDFSGLMAPHGQNLLHCRAQQCLEFLRGLPHIARIPLDPQVILHIKCKAQVWV